MKLLMKLLTSPPLVCIVLGVLSSTLVSVSSTASSNLAVMPSIISDETTALAGPKQNVPANGVVLIQFWASWCSRCSSMFEDLARFAEDHPKLPVIALSIDEDEAAAEAYLAKRKPLERMNHLSFRHDRSGRLKTMFSINAVPTVLLLSSDGKTLSKVSGHLKKSDLLKISRALNQRDR